MKKPKSVISCRLVALFLLFAGCATDEEYLNTPLYKLEPVIVEIQVNGDNAKVPVPSKGDAEYRRAVAQLQQGNWSAAAQRLQILVAKSPSNWVPRYALAVAEEGAEQHLAAADTYRQALRLKGADRFSCEAGLLRIESRQKGDQAH